MLFCIRYKTVFLHFRKWSKAGKWQNAWAQILFEHKSIVDLSSRDIDGSHTPCIKRLLIRVARNAKQQIFEGLQKSIRSSIV